MLKNSCFFIICWSYFSLPRACIHCGNVFFVACEVTFIAKKIFSEDFCFAAAQHS